MTEDELEDRLAPMRATLLAARAEREPPFLDDKVIAAWNGLMIGAFATAGGALFVGHDNKPQFRVGMDMRQIARFRDFMVNTYELRASKFMLNRARLV